MALFFLIASLQRSTRMQDDGVSTAAADVEPRTVPMPSPATAGGRFDWIARFDNRRTLFSPRGPTVAAAEVAPAAAAAAGERTDGRRFFKYKFRPKPVKKITKTITFRRCRRLGYSRRCGGGRTRKGRPIRRLKRYPRGRSGCIYPVTNYFGGRTILPALRTINSSVSWV